MKTHFFYFLIFFMNSMSIYSAYQVTTSSYTDLVQLCSGKKILIVIDLFDVGFEQKNPLLHRENLKNLKAELLKQLGAKFKVNEYIKSLQNEAGMIMIPEFLDFYQECLCDALLLSDSNYFVAEKDKFRALKLNYDSYKNGVLFYRGDAWIKVVYELSVEYDGIVFISTNKGRVAKFLGLNLSNKNIGILFVRKRPVVDLQAGLNALGLNDPI